jgi:hypothetical protein
MLDASKCLQGLLKERMRGKISAAGYKSYTAGGVFGLFA